MPFTRKALTDDDIKAIRDFKAGIKAGLRQFGISENRYRRIKNAPSLEEAIAADKPKHKEHEGGNDHKTDVALAEVKVRGSPVRFRIKDDEIVLAADDLLTSYFIYLDMRRRLSLKNSFSESITIAMKTTWSLTQSPIINEGGEIQNAG